jgi:hypothetical protein
MVDLNILPDEDHVLNGRSVRKIKKQRQNRKTIISLILNNE